MSLLANAVQAMKAGLKYSCPICKAPLTSPKLAATHYEAKVRRLSSEIVGRQLPYSLVCAPHRHER